MATWMIDAVHSHVEFSLDYMGLSTWRSGFRRLEGSLSFEEARPAEASVTASIDAASVDVVNERLYGQLMGADFFDKEHHPAITFRSTRVTPVDARRFKIAGDLTIKGTTRPVVLETEYRGQAKSPFTGKMVAAFRAETSIDKRDFGLAWNAPVETGATYVGERLTIVLHIAAQRQD